MACNFQKTKAGSKHYALMTQMAKPLLREIFPVIFGNALQTGGSTIHHVKLLI